MDTGLIYVPLPDAVLERLARVSASERKMIDQLVTDAVAAFPAERES